ncbi:MAG: hypothetical protein ACLP8S_03875 [Solirubrobacteraceae bacterium]
MEITDEMVKRALEACARHVGQTGPIRMRAALEAALVEAEAEGERPSAADLDYDIETELNQMGWLR